MRRASINYAQQLLERAIKETEKPSIACESFLLAAFLSIRAVDPDPKAVVEHMADILAVIVACDLEMTAKKMI